MVRIHLQIQILKAMIIRNRPCCVYDVEIFSNVFHAVLYNTETRQLYKFEVSERKNQIQELCEMFITQNLCFVGYNNIHYDNPIINYCIEFFYGKQYSYQVICQTLANLSKSIIHDETQERWRRWKFATKFATLDILTMLYSKSLRVSLKEMQVTMHYDNVQEFVCDWTKPLAVEDIDAMIDYNINDVMSTARLLEISKDDIELRINIEDEYHIDCLSKDGVGIGAEILKQRYLKRTGLSWSDLKDLRSPMDEIPLKDVILPVIEFKHPVLKALLAEMKGLTVSAGRNGWNKKFIFHERKISIGVGGIHSINKPEIIIPKEDELLLDADVGSMYPSLILQWEFVPPHLIKAVFMGEYHGIYDERMLAKHEDRKLENETKKLALNAATGNYQNKYSWLFSPFAVMQIRMNGQLFLLMLAERLIEIGCTIIQYNTDGVFLKCPKSKKEEYDRVIAEFEKISKLNMETESFKAMYQLAINDYFAVHSNGKIKEKGIFITKTKLGKGLMPKIIPKAIQNYFLHNIPVKDTLAQAADIKDFLMSEKTGKQWIVMYNNIEQQRTNRFYASTNGAYLRKEKNNNVEAVYEKGLFDDEDTSEDAITVTCQNMLTASGVTLLNKFDDIPIIQRNINYRYYYAECVKIIDELKPRQKCLW